MQVLLGAATFFFCCCRVAAFGSQDLALRTWVSGPRYLALTTDGHRQSWSIFDSHDLSFRTSIFGSQDLGFRT
jgi:hypothetical protein